MCNHRKSASYSLTTKAYERKQQLLSFLAFNTNPRFIFSLFLFWTFFPPFRSRTFLSRAPAFGTAAVFSLPETRRNKVSVSPGWELNESLSHSLTYASLHLLGLSTRRYCAFCNSKTWKLDVLFFITLLLKGYCCFMVGWKKNRKEKSKRTNAKRRLKVIAVSARVLMFQCSSVTFNSLNTLN